VSLTAQQPLLNIARTAIEALAGVLAGAQSLHTNSYDETLALPTEHAALIALRTQQMIAHESGAASVVDPLGGSWHVEQLTDQLETEARAYLAEIDARGGMVAAVQQGYPQSQIADAAYAFQRAVESGERVVVGVNAFAMDESHTMELHHTDPAVEAQQVEQVQAHRAARNQAACDRALTDLRLACETDHNVMPPLIHAVRAGATMGETCDVFRAVWGGYSDPGHW
jgi:methylmalonyl-CoA mutase N-terminal domain/subunit